ncbi:thioredoxin-like [Glandiceps talaboti]
MTVPYVKTKADFDAALKGAGSKLVAVDFTASWCGPCKFIGPKFEEMSKEFTDVVFIKVDVDDNGETAEANGVSAMPTFIFFKNGEKVDSLTGADEKKLRELLTKNK